MGAVTADLECMDIAQDTSTGKTPTTIFPEMDTETVVDISIRSALHYLQYKEILLAADDILTQSIPAELHTACLTFGQLQSLREHARTFITVQDILSSLIHHTRTEANPTAAGHPMLAKTRQSLTDLQTDLNVWKPHVPAQTNPKTSPTATTAPTNPNVRPIMIMKPANIHAFMKQLNADLNIKITCKLTTQYLKLEPDTESLHATITKFLDDTNVPYYIITPKISDLSKLSFVDSQSIRISTPSKLSSQILTFKFLISIN
ncbi:hypothetical protein CEXT_268111 [Caerostris extrusa]|uniref:Uncharacterized protein n=1 Tax=Caerostris extrusa TaxID=172846 RepID=A0AAV4Q5L7_CAEEX|nr:hypothetical protein CEXT_268111 [Caerostris extrusa]